MDFINKVIWITGATSGIGGALAKELHTRGAKLAISGRRTELLEKLKQELQAPDTLVLPFDVSNKIENQQAISKIQQHFGRLDLAIFNAGIGQFVELNNFADTFEKVMPVNFMGVVYGIDAALKLFLQQGHGYIAVVSSLTAFGGIPCVEAYCASKAALRSMMQGLEAHLHGTNIKVTTIYPGFIKTPLTSGNNFPMPFIMSAEKAAKIIANGLAKEKSVLCFPKLFGTLVRALNFLPHGCYIKLMVRFNGIKKQEYQ